MVRADPAATRLSELDDLITSAITQLTQAPPTAVDKDVMLRLRLARASHNLDERTNLLTRATQLRLPRHHAALVLATQARREALDGSAAEAIEFWRHAVGHAIHEGHTDNAAGWLYAIRATNIRYARRISSMDEEHLLAQALPKTGHGQLVRRVRNPEADARRAALNDDTGRAIVAARRWLADCIVTGSWAEEEAAARLLGDLYARNAEPIRATSCYRWSGNTKKAVELADNVGDLPLHRRPVLSGPWWQQTASLAVIAAQQDLLDDDTAGKLLSALLDQIRRGRAGELIEDPTRSLTLQATKTVCALGGRGSSDDARALLDLFAADVARAENQYQCHDEQHVQACQAIITQHPELTLLALERIIDLAEVGTHKALNALHTPCVIDLLRDPSPDHPPTSAPVLTTSQRQRLRERLHAIAASGRRYEAGLAIAVLGENDPATTQRAFEARDRILNRSEPDGCTYTFGSRIVPDSYLVSFLSPTDQRACLDKLLAVAADRRETAGSRQDALTAAANLVLDQDTAARSAVHARSRAFVAGTEDGSALDAETTNPHPLSAMKIRLASASLRAAGLHLALCSAVTGDERMWVRDQAAIMLGADDPALVRRAAVTLPRLGAEIMTDLDASLLSGHPLPVVRELAAFLASADPIKYAGALQQLTTDSDRRVRVQLAQRLHAAHDEAGPEQTVTGQLLATLSADIRHSVRRAATGLGS